MLPNTLKINSTHQDKDDEMDAVILYSHQEYYVNVTLLLALFSVMLPLIHYVITLRYAVLQGCMRLGYSPRYLIVNSWLCVICHVYSNILGWLCAALCVF